MKRKHWWLIVNKKTGAVDPSYGVFNNRAEARNRLVQYLSPRSFKVIKVVPGARTMTDKADVTFKIKGDLSIEPGFFTDANGSGDHHRILKVCRGSVCLGCIDTHPCGEIVFLRNTMVSYCLTKETMKFIVEKIEAFPRMMAIFIQE